MTETARGRRLADVLRGWAASPFGGAGQAPAPAPRRPEPRRPTREASATSAGPSWIRAIAVASVCGLLLWQVTERTLGTFLAGVSPRAALVLDGSDPTALVRLADGLMATEIKAAEIKAAAPAPARPESLTEQARPAQESRDRRAEIARLARRAALADPLNATAFRLLGQVALLDGDVARARELMQAAVTRSLQETVAVSWMMLDRAENKDAAGTAKYLDILLRTRPHLLQAAMPAVLATLALPDGPAALAALLGRDPPWRREFFRILPERISQPKQPLDVLLALRDTPAPPRDADLKAYLDLLVARGRYEVAYYTWLQFLPEAELSTMQSVYNGGFEKPLSGLTFDWTFSAGAGASVEVEADPEDPSRRALHVAFSGGQVAFGGVGQTLMLTPGTYTVSGRFRANLVGQRGLVWRLRCAGSERVLGETAMLMGRQASWKPFAVEARVPDADCRAQTLRLELDARFASERLVHGDAWFDDIAVARTGTP